MSLTAIREHVMAWRQANLPAISAAQNEWFETHNHYCICDWSHELEIELDGSLNGGLPANKSWRCMDISTLGDMPARAKIDAYTSIHGRGWILSLEVFYAYRWYELKYTSGSHYTMTDGWELMAKGDA